MAETVDAVYTAQAAMIKASTSPSQRHLGGDPVLQNLGMKGYPLVNKHSYRKWPFIADFPI